MRDERTPKGRLQGGYFGSRSVAGSCSCLKDLSCHFANRSNAGSRSDATSCYCLKDLSCHFANSGNAGSINSV